jgi:hypothetical protein
MIIMNTKAMKKWGIILFTVVIAIVAVNFAMVYTGNGSLFDVIRIQLSHISLMEKTVIPGGGIPGG